MFRHLTALCVLTGVSLGAFGGAAQAQYVVHYSDAAGYGYRNQPLYPYVAQPQPVYADPRNSRSYPYVGSRAAPARAPVSQTDPALVEELRSRRLRASAQEEVGETPKPKTKIHKTIVVREKPIVRDHVRVVDDPPIIVQREVSEDQLVQPRGSVEPPPAGRVIHAEAEVTIIGPDRMNIRLYRKRDGNDANAKAERAGKAQAKADTKSNIR
jgi:hypothetical protein